MAAQLATLRNVVWGICGASANAMGGQRVTAATGGETVVWGTTDGETVVWHDGRR